MQSFINFLECIMRLCVHRTFNYYQNCSNNRENVMQSVTAWATEGSCS